jgi:hypothetical protein
MEGSSATSQRVHPPFLTPRGRKRRIEETRSVQNFLPAARTEHQSFPSLPKQQIRPRTTSFAYRYIPCVFARSIRARATARAMMTSRHRFMRSALRGSARPPRSNHQECQPQTPEHRCDLPCRSARPSAAFQVYALHRTLLLYVLRTVRRAIGFKVLTSRMLVFFPLQAPREHGKLRVVAAANHR